MKKLVQQKKHRRWSVVIPWLLLYLFIFVFSSAFAYGWLNQYQDQRLPTGYIELSVAKTEYQLGESIEFLVTNYFPVPVFITNQCPSEPLNVYRWENEQWVQLHASAVDTSECYSEERNVAIPSEGSRSYRFDDWPGLFTKPGVYRIAAKLDHYDDIPFQDFVIMEKPEEVVIEDHVTVYKERTVAGTPSVLPQTEPKILVPDLPPVTPYVDEEYEEDEDEEREEDDD